MNIPENSKIKCLEYGAHWRDEGQSGWYVRMDGGPWVAARGTPASDELPDDYESAYWETAKWDADEYVRNHADDDSLDDGELAEAFRGMFQRDPDADDIEQGLWSLLNA